MQPTASPKHEPRQITLHVSRRVFSLLGLLLVLTLPFMGGSATTPRARVVLAAGVSGAAPAPGAAGLAGPAAGAAGGGSTSAALTAAGTSVAAAQGLAQAAAGEALFLFPSLALDASEVVSTLSATGAQAGLSWPLHGPVASGFGPRIHPVLGRPMFHTGIDLMAACGTPIHAAADGQVVYAAITPSWGRRVIIRHSTSLETGYAHMSQFLVQQGDVVKRGQVIGLVGTTGWSTGCHLHFDVIVDGNYVDPAPYLGLPSTSTAEVPYQAAPQVGTGAPGPLPGAVEDGDVPVTAAVPSGAAQARTPRPYLSTATADTTPSASHTHTTPPSSGSPASPTPSASSTTKAAPSSSTQPPATSTTSPPPATSTTTSTTSRTGGTSTSADPTTSGSRTSSPSGSSPCDCSSDGTQPPADQPTTTTAAGSSTPAGTASTSKTSAGTTSTTGCSTSSTCPTTTGSATASVTGTVAATTEALLATGTQTKQP